MWMAPFTWIGSNPLEVPGSSDTSPLIIVAAPVLVMAAVAMIPKEPAEPRATPPGAPRMPVVKVQGFGTSPAASRLPARSLAPTIVAVYLVLAARGLEGVKVTTWVAAL